MSPFLENPQPLLLSAEQLSKLTGGIIAQASAPPTVDWVQTGILGAAVLAIVWGFKTGFLALGRELTAERERRAAVEEENKALKTTNAEMTQTLTAVAVQMSGAVVPALGQTMQAAKQVVPAGNQLDEVAALMRDVRERLDRDG